MTKRRRANYEQVWDGENDWVWERPVHRGFKLGCCDCGLVHVMDFRIVGKEVQFRIKRDNRATAGVRRGAEFKKGKK